MGSVRTTVFDYGRLVQHRVGPVLRWVVLSAVPALIGHLSLTLVDSFLEPMDGCHGHFGLIATQFDQVPVSPEVQKFRRAPGQLLSVQAKRILQIHSPHGIVTPETCSTYRSHITVVASTSSTYHPKFTNNH